MSDTPTPNDMDRLRAIAMAAHQQTVHLDMIVGTLKMRIPHSRPELYHLAETLAFATNEAIDATYRVIEAIAKQQVPTQGICSTCGGSFAYRDANTKAGE